MEQNAVQHYDLSESGAQKEPNDSSNYPKIGTATPTKPAIINKNTNMSSLSKNNN